LASILIISSAKDLALAGTIYYTVSTRGHFDQYRNLMSVDPYNPFNFQSIGCSQEAVIYVHGVWTSSGQEGDNTGQMFENADEIFNRGRLSLENRSYIFPLIGFSWDSDTEISSDGWRYAQIIAKENGPKLAQFIIDFTDWCRQQNRDINIRLIGHSWEPG